MVSKKSKVTEEADEIETESQPKEAYQALYRRFRPSQFADVFGQESTTETLSRTIVEKRIAHAYLFTGLRGTGKTTTARIFAAAINCENLGKDGEPCQNCSSCYGVSNGTQGLGVIEYDAASNRSVDGIRSIIEQTRTASTLSRNKVFIIDEVHALTGDAITAFLKTLEEPPPGVIFILCTTNPEKVLPTIRSRTIQFKFNLVKPEIMEKLVTKICEQADIKITKSQIRMVVSEGKGSPRDTLSVLERVALGGNSDDNDYPSDITNAITDGNISDIIFSVADAVNSGVDLTALSQGLLSYWRDCILALQAPALLGITNERLEVIIKDARRVKLSRLFRMVTSISDTLGKMSYAGDPRILLETTLMQILLPDLSTKSYTAIQEQLADIQDDVAIIMSTLRTGGSIESSSAWPAVDSSDIQYETPSDGNDESEEEKAGLKANKTPKKDKVKKNKLESELESKDESDNDERDESELETIDDNTYDLEYEDIINAILDDPDVTKRVSLILQKATVIDDECSVKTLVLKGRKVTEDVYDIIEELVKKHAGGRKLIYREKEV